MIANVDVCQNSARVRDLRQRHICTCLRRQAFDLTTKKQREDFLKPHGLLRLPTSFEAFGPAFNPFVQVALDVSHAEAKGIGEIAIGILVDKMLSDNVGKKVCQSLPKIDINLP